jgi:hypothetical protein
LKVTKCALFLGYHNGVKKAPVMLGFKGLDYFTGGNIRFKEEVDEWRMDWNQVGAE